MDNTKTLHLNLSMSPRAIDELKQYSNVKYNSKYLVDYGDRMLFQVWVSLQTDYSKATCLIIWLCYASSSDRNPWNISL